MAEQEGYQGNGVPQRDFFVSYAEADRGWAEWVGWQVEEAGYTVQFQAWDVRAGENVVLAVDRGLREAKRVLALLSPAYLESEEVGAQWSAAFDGGGRGGRLVPVLVRACERDGLLKQVQAIDLVGYEETVARKRLLDGLRAGRGKGEQVPAFPGSSRRQEKHPVFPGRLPELWNVPYPRNPYFTGRERLLEQIAQGLRGGETVLTQPQAISGLGGIGKTQLALEYAYRYYQEYEAVFWVLADTRDSCIASFVAMAKLLELPEREELDQQRVIGAVQRWLQRQGRWLLMLDNADDLALVGQFLPAAFLGHVLITTRASAMGRAARRIEVDELTVEQGTAFVLQRAGLLGVEKVVAKMPVAMVAAAQDLVREMGGLPLALDQAGAYIEATGCRIEDYLAHYKTNRSELLKRRGGVVQDHKDAVATTWKLAFEQIAGQSPAAIDLLRVCAFLHPDAIPLEIFVKGAEKLGPHLKKVAKELLVLDDALGLVQRYSLVRREREEGVLTMHRLVQAVLRDGMESKQERVWRTRVVGAVARAFPQEDYYQQMAVYEQYLVQAQTCIALLEETGVQSREAGEILHGTGAYLLVHYRLDEAKWLLKSAVDMRTLLLGANGVETGESLDRLARVYELQGRYEEAEPLYEHALEIHKQRLGEEHPDTATSMNNLALLYERQGRYKEAEPLYEQALEIKKHCLGVDHSRTATSLDNLAHLYEMQGKYKEAEPLYEQALEIRNQRLGGEHPDTATSLGNLAFIYQRQGRYKEAERLYELALEIYKQKLGGEHPDTALILNNLAGLYVRQGRDEEAERLYVQALRIFEQRLGKEHPDALMVLKIYEDFRRYREGDEVCG